MQHITAMLAIILCGTGCESVRIGAFNPLTLGVSKYRKAEVMKYMDMVSYCSLTFTWEPLDVFFGSKAFYVDLFRKVP